MPYEAVGGRSSNENQGQSQETPFEWSSPQNPRSLSVLLWQEGAEQLVWIFRGNEPIWGVIFRIIEDHHGVLVNPGMRDQECGRIELRA